MQNTITDTYIKQKYRSSLTFSMNINTWPDGKNQNVNRGKEWLSNGEPKNFNYTEQTNRSLLDGLISKVSNSTIHHKSCNVGCTLQNRIAAVFSININGSIYVTILYFRLIWIFRVGDCGMWDSQETIAMNHPHPSPHYKQYCISPLMRWKDLK